MSKRDQVQKDHEKAMINDFISWYYSRTGEFFTVVSRPDPPDAILKSEDRTTWIEVANAFLSDEWARDVYSYATPGEAHYEMAPGPYCGTDASIVRHFLKILEQKLSKSSYFETFLQYGPGMLVIGLQSPLANEQTCELAIEAYRSYKMDKKMKDTGYISKVYIACWLWKQRFFEECK